MAWSILKSYMYHKFRRSSLMPCNACYSFRFVNYFLFRIRRRFASSRSSLDLLLSSALAISFAQRGHKSGNGSVDKRNKLRQLIPIIPMGNKWDMIHRGLTKRLRHICRPMLVSTPEVDLSRQKQGNRLLFMLGLYSGVEFCFLL